MKKFEFSLQKVLDYRLTVEEQAKAKFAEVQRQINETEQLIVDLGHEKHDMMDVRELSLGRLQVQHRYLAQLDNEIMMANAHLRQLDGEQQKTLNAYVEAQRERKVLEKLRDKKKAEYQLEANHEEQKQLDEMANRPKYSLD
ncbi:flagellar FliJ protein [Ligilactobacillus sp. WC1T17]|uniref:Flagellar FliJ protein n=1 Tax=Ligilactobacillus ruminis TaxID=1623 RepID=A0ABY1AB29_9LACO|nr:flagellar FliJ protein [Ligilactobacillus ruminis]